MTVAETETTRALARALARVRTRHALVRGSQAFLHASTVALGAVLLLALVVGPAPSRAASVAALAFALAPVAVFAIATLWWHRRLADAGVADLYRAVSSGIASRARSAVELAREAPPQSSALVAAHLEQVAREVRGIEIERVVRTRRALRRPLVAFGVAVAVVTLLVGTSDRVRVGSFALTHPAVREGVPLALIVSALRYDVTPPPHRSLAETTLGDVPAPRFADGSRVRITVRTTLDARRVEARLPGVVLELRRVRSREFAGEWVARTGGRLEIRAHATEGTFIDARSRNVTLDEDASPRVRFELFGAESPVAPDADVGFRLEADDDVGLVHVSRVVRAPSGVEWRVPLEPAAATRDFAQEGTIRVAELGLRPGDAVQVYAEATDGDEVRGPKTSRSPTRTIVIASRSSDREAASADLRRALEATLGALADRLEHPVEPDAAKRRSLVQGSTASAIEAVSPLGERRQDSGLAPTDVSLLATIARRVRPLATREEALAITNVRDLADLDRRLVDAFEDASLALSDVLAHLELEDAAEIARELDSLRRELVSLVEALRRADSEETRLRIAADIDRARRRMSELAARLARMGDEVPGEFRNEATAQATPRTEDALRSLEAALAANDLGAAERALSELEHEVSLLAKAFQENADGMGETRFGPRERAFQDAMELLAGIEAEQSSLAESTTRVRRAATERALAEPDVALDARTRTLAERARRLRDETDALGGMREVAMDREAAEHSAARLDDVEAALRRGDVGAAQEAMERAQSDLDAMARDLELGAMMSLRSQGKAREAARRARDASEVGRALHQDLLRAIPNFAEHVGAEDRRALEQNGTRQQTTREATDRLARRFAEEVGGAPLSEEAAAELDSIEKAMRDAEGSLGRGDSIAGAETQTDAARKLRRLRESLERASGGGGGEGGGGGGGGGDGMARGSERVEIPGAATSTEATARRRRVLDAMGGDVPDAYRGAVERYYQELLR